MRWAEGVLDPNRPSANDEDTDAADVAHASRVLLPLLRLVALFGVVFLAGCRGSSSLDAALLTLGLSDPAPAARLTVDLVIDPTPGSPGASLATDVDEVRVAVAAVASRPGSLLRIWGLATERDEARVLYELHVPVPAHSWRSRPAKSDEIVETAASAATTALEPAVAAAAGASTSPIATTVDRVLLADAAPSTVRFLTLVTDGRERYAGRNLECGSTPSPSVFASMLARHELLREHSIEDRHLHIQFVRFELGRLEGRRCRATPVRERAVRAAWTSVLEQAGAASVAIRTGHADYSNNNSAPDAGRPAEEP